MPQGYYVECHYAEWRYAECRGGKRRAGNPSLRETVSTVDLLVLTRTDQLHLIWKTVFTFYKTGYLDEEVYGIDPFPSVSIPWLECFSSQPS